MVGLVGTRYEQMELDGGGVVSSSGGRRIGPHGDDSSSTGVDRDAFHRCRRVDEPLAADDRIGAQVVPGTLGEVHLPVSQSGREDWRGVACWSDARRLV